MSQFRKKAMELAKQNAAVEAALKKLKRKSDAELSIAPTVEDINQIAKEETAYSQMTEASKNDTEKYRKYYDLKIVSMKFEKVNFSHLYLFPSVNGEELEWHKMGGHSALIYKYVVAPRLGRRYTRIRKDTDARHRLRDGVISIHWLDEFVAVMAKAGYDDYEINELGLVVYDLHMKVTKQELKAFAKIEKESEDRLNELVVPKNTYPEVYGLLVELAGSVPPKVKRFDVAYRGTIGNEMLSIVTREMEIYVKMANGAMPIKEARDEMLDLADNMLAILRVVAECGMLEMETCAKLGGVVTDLKMAVKRKLVEKDKTEEAAKDGGAGNGAGDDRGNGDGDGDGTKPDSKKSGANNSNEIVEKKVNDKENNDR